MYIAQAIADCLPSRKSAILKLNLILLPAIALMLMSSAETRAQEAVFIVRHAEVLAKPGDDDPPLSEEGLQRALRLAEKLKGAGITAIYSTQTKRTQQTAEPAAKAFQVPIKTISRRDPKALVAALRTDNKNDRVLVFGHFQTVPIIIKELGYQGEIKLDSTLWDELFIVIPRGQGQPTVMRLRL
jgi:phosphohistidine phosphatase SixA